MPIAHWICLTSSPEKSVCVNDPLYLPWMKFSVLQFSIPLCSAIQFQPILWPPFLPEFQLHLGDLMMLTGWGEAALLNLIWAESFTWKSDGSTIALEMGFKEALLRLGVLILGPSLDLGTPQSHPTLLRFWHFLWMLPLNNSLSPVSTRSVIWCISMNLSHKIISYSRHSSGSFCYGCLGKEVPKGLIFIENETWEIIQGGKTQSIMSKLFSHIHFCIQYPYSIIMHPRRNTILYLKYKCQSQNLGMW